MKKLLRAIAIILLGVSFSTGVVFADTGSISNTGPGSTNSISFTETNNAFLNCVNAVNVTNVNNQTAVSGGATVSNNTVGGGATSGSASNSNSTSANIGVSGCALNSAPVTPPPTNGGTTPTTPTGGSGGGQVSGASVTLAGAGGSGGGQVSGVRIAALPETSGESIVSYASVPLAVLGSLVTISSVGVAATRRFMV